jgi:hypothetical protein
MGICRVTRVYWFAARKAVVASDEQELPRAGELERPTRLVLILHVKQKAEAKDESLAFALLLVEDAEHGISDGQPSRAVVMKLSFVILSAEREGKVLYKKLSAGTAQHRHTKVLSVSRQAHAGSSSIRGQIGPHVGHSKRQATIAANLHASEREAVVPD